MGLFCAAGGNAATGISGLGARRGRVQSGTGFFVAPADILVTSRHVIAGCPGVVVWSKDDGLRNARIVAVDARRDLALLSVRGRRRGDAASRYRDDLRRGERIMTVGFGVVAAHPEKAVFTRGTVVGRRVLPPGRRVLIVRADLRPGDSGAPVVDRLGNLLGMVIGRLADRSDLGVVIPAEEINRFLARSEAKGLVRAGAASRGEAAGASIAGMASLVQCRSAAAALPSRGR